MMHFSTFYESLVDTMRFMKFVTSIYELLYQDNTWYSKYDNVCGTLALPLKTSVAIKDSLIPFVISKLFCPQDVLLF